MKAVIVEDDADSRALMREYLSRYAAEHGEVIETETFSNGMDFASDYKSDADIILLDIEMPYMNGLDAAKKIRETDVTVAILFITNMAQYAIRGYEVNAVDFIVKPVSYFNFADKFSKAVRFAERRRERELLIRTEGGFTRLPVSRVLYVEKERNDLVYHTTEGDRTERGSMRELEARLSDCGFLACSSGCLVNLRHVTRTDGSSVTVAGREIWISRRKKKEFAEGLMSYMSGGK